MLRHLRKTYRRGLRGLAWAALAVLTVGLPPGCQSFRGQETASPELELKLTLDSRPTNPAKPCGPRWN